MSSIHLPNEKPPCTIDVVVEDATSEAVAKPTPAAARETSIATIDEVVRLANQLAPADRRIVIARLSASIPVDAASLATRHRPPPRKVYSAPRRFDLATIFVATAGYAFLLGGMSGMGAPSGMSLYVAIVIALVAVAQALLFGGRSPRLASVIVGLACVLLPLIACYLLIDRFIPPGASPFVLLFAIIVGPAFGYIAGTLIGGVFLVADTLQKKSIVLGATRNNNSADPE